MKLIGAQLLGPALSPGAVYVASVLDSSTEILCIKGNVMDADRLKLAQNRNTDAGPSLRYSTLGLCSSGLFLLRGHLVTDCSTCLSPF